MALVDHIVSFWASVLTLSLPQLELILQYLQLNYHIRLVIRLVV